MTTKKPRPKWGIDEDFEMLRLHPARWFLQTTQIYVLLAFGATIGAVCGFVSVAYVIIRWGCP